jgi:hypothetical protein
MNRAFVAAFVAACSGELTVSPTSIAFGDVDFQRERPPAGYDARTLQIANQGDRRLDVVFEGFDAEHLLLAAPVLVAQAPPTLPPLAPGEVTQVTIGVWGYVPGELTTELTGQIRVVADHARDPVVVDWSFTPVRNGDVDTAR